MLIEGSGSVEGSWNEDRTISMALQNTSKSPPLVWACIPGNAPVGDEVAAKGRAMQSPRGSLGFS